MRKVAFRLQCSRAAASRCAAWQAEHGAVPPVPLLPAQHWWFVYWTCQLEPCLTPAVPAPAQPCPCPATLPNELAPPLTHLEQGVDASAELASEHSSCDRWTPPSSPGVLLLLSSMLAGGGGCRAGVRSSTPELLRLAALGCTSALSARRRLRLEFCSSAGPAPAGRVPARLTGKLAAGSCAGQPGRPCCCAAVAAQLAGAPLPLWGACATTCHCAAG